MDRSKVLSYRKKIDETINIVDNVGTVVKSLDTIKKDLDVKPQGEEITNIIKYLIKVSDEQHISVKQLWLDKIPEFIFRVKQTAHATFLPIFSRFGLFSLVGALQDVGGDVIHPHGHHGVAVHGFVDGPDIVLLTLSAHCPG